MTKSPEEYFKDQDFSPQPDSGDFTPAERAFMAKYMGLDSARALEELGLAGADTSKEDPTSRAISGKGALPCLTVQDEEGLPLQAEPAQGADGPAEASPEAAEEGSLGAAAAPAEKELEIPAENALTAEENQTTSPPSPQEEPVLEVESPSSGEDKGTSLAEAVIGAEPEQHGAEPCSETIAPLAEEPAGDGGGAPSPSFGVQEFAEALEDFEPQEEYLEDRLKGEAEIQMVGFFIGGQEFTIPTAAVQEVIRYTPVAKLPAAPPCIAGVINLRGRVTPLVELRDILEVKSARQGEDRFIIICRRQGLQIGMLIERVHTMYRVPQADIEWSIENQLGINADCVAGLFKQNERLVGIVSVDRVIVGILK